MDRLLRAVGTRVLRPPRAAFRRRGDREHDDRRSEPFFLTFRIMRRSYATFSRAWAITTPRMTPTAHYPVAGNLQGAATPMR